MSVHSQGEFDPLDTTLDNKIPKYQIFPAIGIARVGDSRLHSYIANEAPQINFVPADGYRGPVEPVVNDGSPSVNSANRPLSDAPAVPLEGPGPFPHTVLRRIKRMGCRFRIYEFNPLGKPIREINSDNADVEWRVHLVNKKAAGSADWGLGLVQPRALNAGDIDQLKIDSEQQFIAGIDAGPLEMGGEIMRDRPEARYVKLGDLTTDDKGRLIVYGGHGLAESWEDPPGSPNSIRNPGWYDDTSDGIVEATVIVAGVAVEALAARIVVGPPDYVHPCLAPVTLFDLAFDRSGGWGDTPPRTSFTRHIHPVLHRTAFLEWTLFAMLGQDYGRTPKHGHGFTGNHDMHPDGAFLDPRVFETLLVTDPADPGWDVASNRRTMYFDYLKDPSGVIPPGGQGEYYSMPAIEGLTLTQVQYEHFRNFAAIDEQDQVLFDADWPAGTEPGTLTQPELANLDIADLPEALNRAAMDFAVGGPFFPGVEVGAIVAEQSSYVTVGTFNMRKEIGFRIADTIEAGDLTMSLAVPWQTAFNQHNYRTTPGAPTADNLWPSARPVLVSAKQSGTTDDMLWTRPFTRTGNEDKFEHQKMRSNQHMIDNWSKLGFIAPATFYIEVSRTLQEDPDYQI